MKEPSKKIFQVPLQREPMAFKKVMAKCKFVIKQSKMKSLRSFVTKIHSSNPTKTAWNMVRKKKENFPGGRIHLSKDNIPITDTKETVIILLQQFFYYTLF